jgi:Glycosyltransferase family 87
MNRLTELNTTQKWLMRGLLLTAAILVVGATAYRSVDSYDAPEVAAFDTTRQGQFDFHNGIYFPEIGFLKGYNPYGAKFAAAFPVTRQIPPYSPFTLLVHWPLGYLPVHVAEVLYFGVTLGLLWLIAMMTAWGLPKVRDKWTWTLATLLLLLASRAGHTTLFTGYFTVELVFGTMLALRFARRHPVLSGFGLLLASIKPNFIIPLGLMMLARGNYRALVWGFVLSCVGAAIPTAILLRETTVSQFLQDIKSSDSEHNEDDYESPANTWTRVDGLAVVAKWMEVNPPAPVALAVMLLVLTLPALALFKLSKRGDKDGDLSVSGVLVLLASNFSIYHHVYDTLLLIPAALYVGLERPSGTWPARLGYWLLAAGIIFVPCNYLSSEQVLNRLNCTQFVRQCITSMSGIVLLTCLLIWLRRSMAVEPKR